MASKGRHKGISGFDVALIRIVDRGFDFLGRKKKLIWWNVYVQYRQRK